jgi:DNA-directed RNA polymerase specialized sigma24 family protein
MWDASGEGFEAFVASTGPVLRHAFVARYGPDVGSEVTADVLEYGWAHWPTVCSKDNPAGWLFRVGQSRSRRYLHRRVLFPAAEINPMPDVEPGLPAQLEALSVKQRQAVLMVHAFGYSVRQTADVLGVAPSTVQKNAERGLAHLRAGLGVSTDV